MSTSSNTIPSTTQRGAEALRLVLSDEASTERIDGSWWPRSRDLHREARDLVDHFPPDHGSISRLLFSRPDWDNSSKDGRGVRSIRAAQGVVKTGSFAGDDTHMMILIMSAGPRLKLLVIPSDTPDAEAEEWLNAVTPAAMTQDSASVPCATSDWARWNSESSAR